MIWLHAGSIRVREKQKPFKELDYDMIWAPALQLSFCPICWRKEEIVIVKVHNTIVEEFGIFLLSRPFVACKETPRFPQSQACVCVWDCGSPEFYDIRAS